MIAISDLLGSLKSEIRWKSCLRDKVLIKTTNRCRLKIWLLSFIKCIPKSFPRVSFIELKNTRRFSLIKRDLQKKQIFFLLRLLEIEHDKVYFSLWKKNKQTLEEGEGKEKVFKHCSTNVEHSCFLSFLQSDKKRNHLLKEFLSTRRLLLFCKLKRKVAARKKMFKILNLQTTKRIWGQKGKQRESFHPLNNPYPFLFVLINGFICTTCITVPNAISISLRDIFQ